MSNKATYKHLFDLQGDLTRETALRYAFNELPENEQQAVQQHLANCDMCTDTVEGLQLCGSRPQAEAAIRSLQNKLQAGQQNKTTIMPGWQRYLRIAAILVALAGGAVLVTQLLLPEKNELAMEKDRLEPESTTEPAIDADEPLEEETSLEDNQETDQPEQNIEAQPQAEPKPPTESTRAKQQNKDGSTAATSNPATGGKPLPDEPQVAEIEAVEDTEREEAYAAAHANEQKTAKQSRANVAGEADMAAGAPPVTFSAVSMDAEAGNADEVSLMAAQPIATYATGDAALTQYLLAFAPPTAKAKSTTEKQNTSAAIAELYLSKTGKVNRVEVLTQTDAATKTRLMDYLKAMPKWDINNKEVPDSLRKVRVEVPLH